VSDQMTDGRRFRILTVTDNCTRECLRLAFSFSALQQREHPQGPRWSVRARNRIGCPPDVAIDESTVSGAGGEEKDSLSMSCALVAAASAPARTTRACRANVRAGRDCG
jgi:hypothetical protein